MELRFLRFRILIVLLVLVGWQGSHLAAQTVCAGGTLTGTEVLDEMSQAGGQRIGGSFSLLGTNPPGGTIFIDASAPSNEDVIFTGFETTYTSYTIHYDRGPGYNVTYFVSGAAPAVTLSSPDPANLCAGVGINLVFTLSGVDGNFDVEIDTDHPSGNVNGTFSSSVAGDTHTLSYTLNADATFEITAVVDNAATGCDVAPGDLPGPVSFNVLPNASVQTVTGSSVCAPGTIGDIQLQSSEAGVEYRLMYDDGANPLSTVRTWTSTANGQAYTFTPAVSSLGSYTVQATGCAGGAPIVVDMNGGPFTISDAPNPALAVNLAGSGCSGSSHTISVASPESDVAYALYRDGVEVRVPRVPTGGVLEFTGVTTASDNYQVYATRGACGIFLNNSVVIDKTPDSQNITQTMGCEGDDLYVGLDGSESGMEYSLFDGIDGTGNVLETINGDAGGNPIAFSGAISVGGIYSVMAFNPGTGCSRDLGDISISDTPNLTYTLSTASAPVCAGNNIVISLSGSENDIRYRLYRDAIIPGTSVSSVWGNGGSINFAAQSEAGTYYVTASNNGCEYEMPNTEVVIYPQPELYTVIDDDFCAGDMVAITIDDSDAHVSYVVIDAYDNPVSSVESGTPGGITFNAPYPVGNYRVLASSGGCERVMNGSVTVHALPNVNINNLASDYCANAGDVTINGSPSTGINSWRVHGYIPPSPNWFTDGGDNTASFNVDDALAASGDGSYTIYYWYEDPNTGCSDEVGETTTFHSDIQDNIDFRYRIGATGTWEAFPDPGDLLLCQEDDVLELEAFFIDNGSLIGEGTFSVNGDGLSDAGDGTAEYDPSEAGIGNFTITYNYVDANGCEGTVDYSVQIGVDLEFVNLNDLYCLADAASTVSARPVNYTTLPQGGVLSVFRLSDYPGGPTVALDDQTPVGGGGVTNPSINFDPSSFGADTYVFEYRYEHGGCVNYITQEVEIPVSVDASFSTATGETSFCESISSVTLDPDQPGSFTGTGVSGDIFSPATAGPGSYTITHTINTGGCFSTETLTLTVTELPDIDIDNLAADYCESDGSVTIEANTFGVAGGTSTFTSTSNALGVSPITDNGDGTALFDPSLVGPGIYFVSLTYEHPVSGCDNTVTERVEVNTVTYVNFGDNQPGDDLEYCRNGGPVTFTASFSTTTTDFGVFAISSGGAPGFTDNGNNTATLNPSLIPAGDYDVTFSFSNANNCDHSRTKSIKVMATPNQAYVVGGGGRYCLVSTANNITLSGSQISTTYELLLNGMPFSPQKTLPGTGSALDFGAQDSEGTYTVVATNTGSGCSAEMTGSVEVEVSDLSLAIDNLEHALCYSGDEGVLEVTASGGLAPYTYYLYASDGTTLIASNASGSFTLLEEGNYYVEAEDFLGCELINPVPVTINEPASPLALTTVSSPVGCSGCTMAVDCEGEASVSITGGTPFTDLTTYPSGYDIEWTDDAGVGVSASGDKTFIELMPAGDYTVRVTDANGCWVEEVVEIKTVPVIDLIEDLSGRVNVTCNGANTGEFVVRASGGASGAAYQFSLDQITWVNPDAPGGDERTFADRLAGTYNVYVRDANYPRCDYQLGAPIVITQPPALTISELLPAHQDVDCYGGDNGQVEVAALGGSGDYEFTIDGGTSWQTDATNTYLYDDLDAGTYFVRVRDDNTPSCMSASIPIVIDQPDELLINNYTATAVSCPSGDDGTITLVAQGGTTDYVYSLAGPVIRPSQASNVFTNLPAGTYTATVTDDNGCTFNYPDIVISEPASPLVLSEENNQAVLCRGDDSGSFTVGAAGGSGGYEFSLEGAAFVSNSTTEYEFVDLFAGTYNVEVRDAEGCTDNISVTITQPATAFSLTASETSSISCFNGDDGEITGDGVGGASASGVDYVLYMEIAGSWIAQELRNEPTGDAYTFTGLDKGDYRVNALDDNGCAASQLLTIDQPTDEIEITITDIINVTLPGGNDGSIEIGISGGDGPYAIDWSGADAGGADISTSLDDDVYVQNDLVKGIYSVEVTDNNGCSVERENIPVSDPDSPLSLNITRSNPDPCSGVADGAIGLTAIGGNAPYKSITLSLAGTEVVKATSGGAFATYNNLAAGNYLARVVDNTDVAYETTIQLTIPDPLILTFSKNNEVLCNGGNNGSITFSVSGGTPLDGTPATNYYNYYLIPDNGTTISNQIEVGQTITISTLAADDYELQVVDALNCNASQDFDIQEPDAVAFTYTSENLSCFNSGDGSISVTGVTGGWGVAYRLDWHVYDDVGATWVDHELNGPSNISELDVGRYRLTVTGLTNNCSTVSPPIDITQPEELELKYTQQDVTTCFGDDSGVATLTVNGGTPGYQIQYGTDPIILWNGISPYSFTPLAAGNHSFTVEDAKGCTDDVNVLIYQPEELVVDKMALSIDCELANTGALAFEITGGRTDASGDYGYTVSLIHDASGNNYGQVISATSVQPYVVNNITSLPAGDYVLRVADRNSSNPDICEFEYSFTLAHIDVEESITDATCKGVNTGAIDLTLTGGSGDYSFDWTKDGDAAFSRSTKDIGSLSAGVYHVEITDNLRGCTLAPYTFVVENEHTLSINGKERNVSCPGANDGAVIDVDVVDPSSAGLNFSWTGGTLSTPETTQDLTGVGQGTYLLQVTDGDGCVVTRNFVVVEPAPVTFDLTTDIESCEPYSRSITLDNLAGGTGDVSDFDFYWTGPGSTTNTQDQAGISTGGEYFVTVEDANNCTYSQSIIVPGQIDIGYTASHLSCHGNNNGSILLHLSGGSGDYSYVWSTTDGIGLDVNVRNQSGLTAGTYTVTITDNQETDGTGACVVTQDIVLTQPQVIDIDGAPKHIICAGNGDGAITLDVTGGTITTDYTYSWSSANGSGLVADQKNQTDLSGGTYSVIVTDALGCNAARDFTIDEPDPLVFNLDISPSACDGTNSVEITGQDGGSGTYEYVWAGPGVVTGLTVTQQNNLPGGDYQVTMVDASVGQQCSETQTFTLSKPLNVTHTVQNQTCPGSNNGAIDITPQHGVPPYNYAWSTTNGSGLSVSEQDQSGLSAGTYEVVITDSNPDGGGCTFTISNIVVGTSNALSIGGGVTAVRCFGEATGTISINVVGGSDNYDYSWSGPGTIADPAAQNLTGLVAGSYTVEVTDLDVESGTGATCLVSKTFDVPEPDDAIVVTGVDVTDVDCHGSATGAIEIVVAGGTGPYQFQWTGPGVIADPSSQNISDLRAGDFYVDIRDANNCLLHHGPINVDQPAEALSATWVATEDVTVNGVNNGSIEIEVSGGRGSYTILWFDENDDPVLSATGLEIADELYAGTYRVEVTDGNSCGVEIINLIVRQPDDLLDLIISKRNVGPCNGADNGRITADMVGGTLPYKSIRLYNSEGLVTEVLSDNNAVFIDLPAGDYEVVGVDANDVEVREDVRILQPTPLVVDAEVDTHVACRDDATGVITVSVGGGVPHDTQGYKVSLGGGPSGTGEVKYSDGTTPVVFDDLPSGTYTIRVIDDSNVNLVAGDNISTTDAYGDGTFDLGMDCFVESSLEVEQPEAELTISTVLGNEAICEGEKPMLQIVTANWDFSEGDLSVSLSDGNTYVVDESPYQFEPDNNPETGTSYYSILDVHESTASCRKGVGDGVAEVVVHPLPTARIFGDASICYGESTTMGIELTGAGPWDVVISDGTNTWNETYTENFNSFSATPLSDATYEILSVTDTHCSDVGTGEATITVNELPDVAISGEANICEGASTNLSFDFTAGTAPYYVTFTENGDERTVGPINADPYVLTVSPDETTDYVLVSVSDNNNCTTPVVGEVRVTVRPYPERPSLITGDPIVCQGKTYTYSVEAVNHAIGYVWDLPTGATIVSGSGTREIEVEYATDASSGELSVHAVNSCGDGAERSMSIYVDELPPSAGAITGPDELCQGTTRARYSITPIEEATGYRWTVPSGFTMDGDGGAYILVDIDPNIDSFVGTITVTPYNDCGDSDFTSEIDIEVFPLPDANAGPDDNVCGNVYSLAADALTNATWQGKWTVVQGSGSATLTNDDQPDAVASNMSAGDVTFRWTVTTAKGCVSTDDVTIRNNKLPVNVTADRTTVCDGSTTLRGTPLNPSLNVTGQWTAVWPAGSTASFDDATSPNAEVSNMPVGENRFRWTLNQNGCASYAEVTVMNRQADAAVINGPAVVPTCGEEVTLLAVAPRAGWGTGQWSILSGYAEIVSPNSETTVVRNVSQGSVVVLWTVTNGQCSNTASVTLRNDKLTVNAGPDQEVCSSTTVMEASVIPLLPAGIQGSWHVISGSASFTNGNSPTTTVTNLARGVTLLEWRLTNNGCESSDVVTITNNMATQATVGSSQNACDLVPILSGNPADTGDGEVGYWSVVSGGGQFEDASDPETEVTGMDFGANVYRWTINNKNKCTSSADLRVNNLKTFVDAGRDTVVCDNTISLRGNPVPAGMNGSWRVVSGGATLGILDPTKPHIVLAAGLDQGSNEFAWVIENNGCYSEDEVVVINNRPYPVNGGSSYRVITGSVVDMEAIPVGAGMLGTWILQSGGGTIVEPHNPTTRVTDLRRGENVFWWVVTNGNCSDYYEVVIVNGDVVEANAGRPQTICFDATRMEANDPEGAIGSWSVISGTANFENRYEPRTRVTNLSPGDNVLRWTISYGSSGSSSSSFSDVVITNNRPAEAIAGNDVAFCNDEYQLRGNTPATVPENMGTPLWTIVSGGGDLADASDPNTMVTNLAKGVNQLVYAITKGECVLRDTLQIINGLPSVPEAGDDVPICTDSYLLNPNTPTHGTARWRPGSTGGARFEGNTVYDLAQGDNELIYEIYTEWCSLEDVVIVTNNKPSASFAGQNRDICKDTYQLSAEAPLYGVGTWLLVAGAGEIAPADMSNPNAVVTGLASGSNRFKWTVDNNGCTSSSEVEIRYNFIEANAGDEQVICEDFTELRGSNPMQGTGTWGIKGGSGTAVFEDPNDPLTRVTNLDRGENVLTWTIDNRNCSDMDEVVIINNKPTVPDAGDDQSLCDPTTVLQGNVDVVGQGRWTVRSGSATFASATHADAQTDPSANISGLTFGPNILRWTIINEGCTLYDDVVMTYNRIDAHAGNDRTVCADEIILSAQSPLPGSGSWSVPGGQGAAVFESPTSPTTRVTNLGRGTNTLRWTVWHNGCQTHDDMVVVNQMPSTPYAGNDQIICSDFATLDATAPTLGSTGYWRVLTGSAEFENGDETVHNASVTNLAEGDNIFVWTTQKVDGCTLEDQVLIRNNEPSDPYAGADYEEVCSSTFTLKASTPDYGTGIWSFVQGGGNLSDPNNPEATITTLGRGTNVLRWTVSQGNCSKFSEITIVNNTPTTANAGPDIEDCKDVQTLDANVPVHFDNAYWERISGYGELDDLNNPKSPVRNLAFGPNEFQWVIEKGSCTSTDRVVIFNKIPDKAFAGSDQLDVCDTYTVLNANDPESGTGQWSVIKGKGAFDDAAQYNTIVREMGFGENVYRWEVAYGECSTVDEVAIVSHKTEAYAGEDQVVYEPEAVLNANNAGELNAHWLIVGTSTATFTDETFFNTAVYNLSEGINTFGWEINVNGCISYDQVSVDYRPVPDAGFITDVEEGCFPLRVQFTNYSVGGSVYQWIFGDGSTSGDRNPEHVYTQPGQYTVQLNAPGPDGMDGVFTKQILVHDHPVADFTVNPTVVYVPGEKARFYDLSTDAVSWYWDFGDGVVSMDRNPSHEYSDEGVYDVMLTVGNSYECKDTLIVENAVVAEPQGFVVFPNAFKPRPGNASGQVDPSAEYVVVFKPAYRDVDAFLLEIFNRWGQKVFETNDIDSGWDGMYEGQMAPQAVYIYKATGKYYNGREFRQSGSVLLVR
jgi:PKD repeat protein